jgi:Flp pilus assembly pilin Flp
MSSTTDPTPAPAYAGGPTTGQPPAGTRNGLGTGALVVGILALITSWTVIGGIVLGLVAIVLGAVARGRAKRGEATNSGSAVAGLVLGLVSVIIAVVLVAVGATWVHHHKKDFHNLQSCLNSANTQSQRTSCNRQFQKSVNNGN